MVTKRITLLMLAFLVLSLTLVTGFTTIAQEQSLSLPKTLAWSPDGSKIATGHRDGILAIWDGATGNLLTTYQLVNPDSTQFPLQLIRAVRWSPDAQYIAISDRREVPFGIILVINATTGETITHMETQGGFADLAWSPDGQLMASVVSSISQIALADALVIWNPLTGEEIRRINPPELVGIRPIAWSPDSTRIVVGGAIDNNITIWDVTSGNKVQTLTGHTEQTSSVGWSSITDQIASDSGADQTIRIWDAMTGQTIHSISVEDFPGDIAWSTKSSQLAIVASGSIHILDTATGQFTQEIAITDFTGSEQIAWSPYGGRLAYTRIVPSTQTSSLQTLSSSGTEMIVPVATVEQLNNVAIACKASPAITEQSRSLLDAGLVQALTSASIPDFITQIEALPENAIPAGCAADLIAVAEAIIAQE